MDTPPEQPDREVPEEAPGAGGAAVPEPDPREPVAEQPSAPAEPVAEQPSPPEDPAPAGETATAPSADPPAAGEPEAESEAPRARPAVPGADLEVDIVPEGADPLGRGDIEAEYAQAYEDEEEAPSGEEDGEEVAQPIASVAIDLAAGARYRATGKRKTAIARVMLRPGKGTYTINGRALEEHFPRPTLQRNIRQPLETVGYEDRMDVVARLHGGGISAQAGALRHGISRALLEADPNLRGELKRRGFLTRDSRAKERKKAGLKKARKRPQFSKR